MKQSKRFHGACLSAALLAACGGGSFPSSAPTSVLTAAANQDLYVANCLPTNNITVYAAGTTSLLRTISEGVKLPLGLAFQP